MMNQEHKRPVTLEDLLRLKRVERPPAEFWNQFDQALRAKQLAAIVEKRPWWRTVPQLFGGFSRYHLPLGATAILALTVLTVREYRSTNVTPALKAVSSAAPLAAVQSVGGDDDPIVQAAVLKQDTIAAGAENDLPADPAQSGSAPEATLSAHRSPVVALTGKAAESTPTARFIATNLALAKATEPAIAQNLLGASRGFEARASAARVPVVEPLSQMSSPSDVRRSRLLNGAAMSVSMNTVAPARPAEFRSRRLSDEQLYETISRIDVHGNGVAMKF